MLLLLIHFAATASMTGLIWFVQIVHYPLFAAVGADRFTDYETNHQRRTGYVVGPLMLMEMVTAVALLLAPVTADARPLAAIGLAMLVIIWLSTALLQVPAHRALERGYDPAAHRRLVLTNWLRTTLWSARTVLAAALTAAASAHE